MNRIATPRAAATALIACALPLAATGIGIEEKDMPVIFNPFRRSRKGAGGEREGTCLGLSITKMIVDACGGDISVESTPGSGTTFKFSYPIQIGKCLP